MPRQMSPDTATPRMLAADATLRLSPAGRPGQYTIGRGLEDDGTLLVRVWGIELTLHGARFTTEAGPQPRDESAGTVPPMTLTSRESGQAVVRFAPAPGAGERKRGGLLGRLAGRGAETGGPIGEIEAPGGPYTVHQTAVGAPGRVAGADGEAVAALRLNGDVLLVEAAAPLDAVTAVFAGALALRTLPEKDRPTFDDLSHHNGDNRVNAIRYGMGA